MLVAEIMLQITSSRLPYLARVLSHNATSTSSPSLAAARYLSSSNDDLVKSAFGYCVQQVKRYDYENYVWMVQLPKEQRPALFALRAFNVETALVADQVKSKEVPVVQLRYQWWRDGVTSTFRGTPPPHPVFIALHSVITQQQQQQQQQQPRQQQQEEAAPQDQGVPASPFAAAPGGKAGAGSGAPQLKAYHLKRIIDTREEDLLDLQPPLGVEGLERYAEGTASQLLYLQLAAVGVASREADHAASHLGKAVGITTLLKGTAFHGSQRRSYLPIDLCAKHGVSQEDIYSGNVTEGLRDVVLGVAGVAKAHLDEARALGPRLPRAAASVLLPSLSCSRYLTDLEAENFDVFSPKLQQRGGGAAPLSHVLQVKWNLLTGTF